MYATERWFPGTKLSARLIRQLTGSAEPAHTFARSLDRSLRGCHVVDAVTVAKARYSDYSGAMEKTRLSSEYLGMSAVFPFCDKEMIDYYFNLPNALRFDDQTLETKIAFKEWLKQQSVTSEYFRIKGSFRYNIATMFRDNHQSVIDTVSNSDNIEFTPSIQRMFDRARYDYFTAQQAYLIFSLVVWADSRGLALNAEARQALLAAGS